MENAVVDIRKIAREYVSKIEKIGFSECGYIKDLDIVPTQNGGKLSIGLECLDRDLWDFDRAFPLIKSLGIRRARLQSGWQKTEKTEGVYDFAWLDNQVDKLVSEGIDPFISLSYGNKLYCNNPEDCPQIDNGGVGHIPVVYENERKAWQNYVRATVEHFGDRVKYFEIWNEPDVINFCRCPQMTWPEAYMELVKLTAPIIREILPDALIISCTALATNTQLLFDMGLGDYVDIHSYHSYNAWPELIGDSQANMMSYIKAKCPNIKFWRGEAGYPSYNDPKSKGALHNKIVSETRQAKFALRHLLCDMENDLLDCTSYFHAYDFLHYMREIRYHYGLIRHEDLSKKPAYHCVQTMAHLFDGKTEKYKGFLPACLLKSPPAADDEKLVMSVKVTGFEIDGNPVFAYYVPKEVDDEVFVASTSLVLPYMGEKMKDPVILDPLTRKLYPVSDSVGFPVPVTDYPMFVMDKSYISGIAEISDVVHDNKTDVDIKQFYEG